MCSVHPAPERTYKVGVRHYPRTSQRQSFGLGPTILFATEGVGRAPVLVSFVTTSTSGDEIVRSSALCGVASDDASAAT
jgi:hypothetical protein